MLTCVEALRRLLDALPKCCACGVDNTVVYNEDRWGLCERCFNNVPCGDFPPTIDLRGAVYGALAVLASEDSLVGLDSNARFRGPSRPPTSD